MLGLGHDQLFSLLQQIHGQYQWIIQIGLTLLVGYTVTYLIRKSYNKLLPKAKKSAKIWDDVLIEAAYRPFIALVYLLVTLLILEIINFELLNIPFFDKITLFYRGFVVIIFTSFFLKFGKYFETSYIRIKSQIGFIDRTTIRALFNLYQGIIILFSVLTLLQVFGIPLSGVIAFGGIGGIAVGFAAKDLLANFFGGMMIFLDRPFVIGDMVRSPDREIEGIVEHIGWRQVCIRNLEQRPIYVPNSLFSSIVIENPSRMLNRRIKQTFSVRYDDVNKLNLITNAIEKYLRNSPEIDQTKHILVALITPNSYALDILIETFTKVTNKVQFYQVQHAIFIQILSIIESFGAQCPFPTQTVFLENSQAVSNHVEKKLQ